MKMDKKKQDTMESHQYFISPTYVWFAISYRDLKSDSERESQIYVITCILIETIFFKNANQ